MDSLRECSRTLAIFKNGKNKIACALKLYDVKLMYICFKICREKCKSMIFVNRYNCHIADDNVPYEGSLTVFSLYDTHSPENNISAFRFDR